MDDGNKIWIFDTTLRDGEQALKASLTEVEKVAVAQAIARLNVDVMEVGFPVSSPSDFNAVSRIANEVHGPIICGLARAVKADIDACGNALAGAEKRRIHTFIASSPIHLKHKLRKTLAEATEQAVEAIRHARRYTTDVEFSCEDAGRTPIEDLCYMVERAIAAGATTINIPDTVGYTLPHEFAETIWALKEKVPNIEEARISVHCHNDLGLAVANSIAGIEAGARQIECTMNGIGERAGNAALEEAVMALKIRQDKFKAHTQIKSDEIYRCSRTVSQICRMPVQPNKAIVGENAFSHSSGIHQDGVLKAENTYEIMRPEDVGVPTNELNLTSRSGRHVIQHRLHSLGYAKEDYDMERVYADYLELADKKGTVYDYDLEALVFFNTISQNKHYDLSYFQANASSEQVATATVAIEFDGQVQVEAATGNGPVEAAFQAIERITGQTFTIIDYTIDSKGKGADALGQVDLILESDNQRFHGSGLATDVVEASIQAYIHALNDIHRSAQIHQFKHQNLRKTG
ncbi:2-isopropylmalate synthase [Algicola sagamiensis]|uniref:2-isopropylmalate synthase n=1 Tax=Algicola sagamiensis TaxID=163869 RepID=UPI0003A02255|nr:2-isopropylmalate synthase [Algicola sagamiensis]